MTYSRYGLMLDAPNSATTQALLTAVFKRHPRNRVASIASGGRARGIFIDVSAMMGLNWKPCFGL
jgi:hypothetical protein